MRRGCAQDAVPRRVGKIVDLSWVFPFVLVGAAVGEKRDTVSPGRLLDYAVTGGDLPMPFAVGLLVVGLIGVGVSPAASFQRGFLKQSGDSVAQGTEEAVQWHR